MRRLLLPLLALVLAATAWFWFAPAAEPTRQEPVNGRLPSTAIPDHYLIRLTVLPDQAGFRGEVEIGLQLRQDSKSLYLHGRDLNVNRVEVRRGDRDVIIGHYQQLTPQGLARIDFDETIPAGFLTLVMHYDGHYTSTSEGLSRVNIDNNWYVFSQLHAVDARRVFPGFDDPSFKASFELEIISWRTDTVIGNSLSSETRLLPDQLKLSRLNPTPRLPTYLINISVGPFEVINGPVVPANEIRKNSLNLRAITVKGEGGRSQFALDHTAAMLVALERYFGIPYPFDKLDLIAIPNTSTGVLENPGAINFRDQLMLHDESSTLSERQEFLAYNAHALAHQWFGNLVTMPWWTDLWLNEGFADWLGYDVAAQSYPDYPLTLAMQRQLESSMERDGRNPRGSIIQRIDREEDIQTIFSNVANDKAMGLLRMYQRYLGSEQFRTGLRNYFARHAFGNAGATELFQSLGDAVADPAVTLSFNSFLHQPGLPHIRIEQQCANDTMQLTLTQTPYTPAGSQASSQLWLAPICLRNLDTGNDVCRMLSSRETQWSPGWNCAQAFVPNAGGAGYFRWQTDPLSQQRLQGMLPKLPRAEAMDWVANATAAFRAGRQDVAILLNAMPLLAQHSDPAVLDSTLDHWRYVLNHVASPAAQQVLQQRLRDFFARTAGIDSNDTDRQQFRALDLRDSKVRSALLAQHKAEIDLLRADIPLTEAIDAVAVTIALDQDPSLIQAIEEKLQHESHNALRAPLIQAIAWQNASAFMPTIQRLLLSPALRIHERHLLLHASLTQANWQLQQWQWLQSHFSELLSLLPEYQRNQFPELAEPLCDEELWQNVQTFLTQNASQLTLSSTMIASTNSHVSECVSLRQTLVKSDLIKPETRRTTP